MEVLAPKEQRIPSKEEHMKKVVDDMLDVVEEVFGIAASPNVFWTLVMLNCSGIGHGFNGYVTNPHAPNWEAVPSAWGTLVEVFRGWSTYKQSNGLYKAYKDTRESPLFETLDQIRLWIISYG